MRVRRSLQFTPVGPRSSERNAKATLATSRERQRAKIREIGDTLAAAGLRTLDDQAAALMLSRSTTWNLLNGKHKGSGISAAIIKRMLAAPRLPPPVRATILQYVAEKTAGLYGDSKVRLRNFTGQLLNSALADSILEDRKRG
jgi:hypothetical protein